MIGVRLWQEELLNSFLPSTDFKSLLIHGKSLSKLVSSSYTVEAECRENILVTSQHWFCYLENVHFVHSSVHFYLVLLSKLDSHRE